MDNDAVYKLIAENTHDWESWISPSGQPRWVNQAVERITGFTVSDCLAMPRYPADLIYPIDLPVFRFFTEAVSARQPGNDLALRVQRKDGAVIWTAMSWQPMRDTAGDYLGVRLSVRDTSHGLRNGYGDQLRRVASQLMREGTAYLDEPAHLYALLSQRSAQALQVARVGVWLFEEQAAKLVCQCQFELASATFNAGQGISRAQFPNYFEAISSDRLVVAPDAVRHPLTCELAQTYLIPNGIASMLDAPIVRNGVTVGVVCHEHLGPVRHWSAEELAFAESLADFVALSLEAYDRRQGEARIQQLAAIIEATSDFVGTASPGGIPTYLNAAGRRMLGLQPHEPLALRRTSEMYTEAALRRRNEDALPTAMAQGIWEGETELKAQNGEVIPVWHILIAHRDEQQRVNFLSSVIRDLREQKRIELDLKQLNAELEQRVAERTAKIEEVNRNLEAFAYSVSHDLKAPLRGIDGYSRLLLEDYRPHLPEEAQLFIENIRAATERMNQLIDDLLAYSRLGRRNIAISSFSLGGLLERILAERQIELAATAVNIDNQVGDIQIRADLDCLLQALRNLIDNAIKFCRDRPQPRVCIWVERQAGQLLIGVSDNGCGFDMKYHDRIFEIFQRLHRLEDFPGTGVGLAIVSKAMERLGGRVWAQSELGKGATFYLELPQ